MLIMQLSYSQNSFVHIIFIRLNQHEILAPGDLQKNVALRKAGTCTGTWYSRLFHYKTTLYCNIVHEAGKRLNIPSNILIISKPVF